MSAPAETQILDEIEARLKSITTANGYNLTLAKIERGRLEPFSSGDIPAINYWPTSHRREDNEYGFDEHTLSVVVDMRDKTRDDPFPNTAAEMIADIITALNRDTTAPAVTDAESPELGETVTSLTMRSSGYQIGEGQRPWVGAVVEIDVTYQSESGDMFNYEP